MRGDLPAGTVTFLSPTSSRTLQLKARGLVATAVTTFVAFSGRRGGPEMALERHIRPMTTKCSGLGGLEVGSSNLPAPTERNPR
jgi:hypothetical protein